MQAMGSPAAPDATQYATLVKAGQLAELGPANTLPVTQGHMKVEVKLPRQAVELLVFDWK